MKEIGLRFQNLELVLSEEDGALVSIREGRPLREESPLLLEARKEVLSFLEGKRKSFDVPYRLTGTAFQKRVLQAVLTIPYGETRTYKDIAALLSCKACRAVGNALHRNPLPFLVPCHRVVPSSGGYGSYRFGAALKAYLIEKERSNRRPPLFPSA